MKHLVSNTPRDFLATLAQKESQELVSNLLEDPAQWRDNVQKQIARVTTQAAWNDNKLKTAEKAVWNADNLIPRISPDGAIENKFPFLTLVPNWIPLSLQPWKAQEIARYNQEREFWFGQMEKTMNRSDQLQSLSWMEKFLFTKGDRDHGVSIEEAGYAIGMLTTIGSVLLSSPIQSLLLALCFHPEWQSKAQVEIDRECGDRAPHPSDMSKLPTVRALVREVFRWRPPVPLGKEFNFVR